MKKPEAKDPMPYTLIMKDRQMGFYILELAEMYQRIYGGVLLKDNGRPLLKLVDKLAA
jgi:hypothetical protein